jgi:hypothetical protein
LKDRKQKRSHKNRKMLGNNSMIMAVGYTNLKWHGTMQNHILCPWKQEGKRGHSEVKCYLANKIRASRLSVPKQARGSRRGLGLVGDGGGTRQRPWTVVEGGGGGQGRARNSDSTLRFPCPWMLHHYRL